MAFACTSTGFKAWCYRLSSQPVGDRSWNRRSGNYIYLKGLEGADTFRRSSQGVQGTPGVGAAEPPAEVPPVLRELSAKSKAKPPAAAETEEKEEPVVPKVEKEEPNYSPDKSPEKPVPEEEEPRGKEKKSKPSSSQEKTRARSSGIHRSRRRERRSRSRSRKRRRSSTRRGGSKHRSPTGGSVEQGRFRGVTEGRTGLRCLGGPL